MSIPSCANAPPTTISGASSGSNREPAISKMVNKILNKPKNPPPLDFLCIEANSSLAWSLTPLPEPNEILHSPIS